MSIGRSQEEQELTSLLAKTLVQKEVMEPMEKIGWGHGTPPPPDRGGQPAPAEGAPGKEATPADAAKGGQPAPKPGEKPAAAEPPKADTPTIEKLVALYESLRDPETGLIGKKYKTIEEAIKGGFHLTQMANQAFSKLDEAEKQLSDLRAENLRLRQPAASSGAVASRPQGSVEVPAQAQFEEAKRKYDKVLSDINEDGGVLTAEHSKALSEAQVELSAASAEVAMQRAEASRAQKEDAEKAEWADVDAYMKEHHPKAELFAEETALFLKTQPLLATAVDALFKQGRRKEATELAWTEFEKVHAEHLSDEERKKAEGVEEDLAARERVRQEKLEQARKDAGVVQGSGGSGAHPGTTGVSRDEINAAADAMRREGDAPGSPAAMAWRRMVIPLDPAIFGGP